MVTAAATARIPVSAKCVARAVTHRLTFLRNQLRHLCRTAGIVPYAAEMTQMVRNFRLSFTVNSCSLPSVHTVPVRVRSLSALARQCHLAFAMLLFAVSPLYGADPLRPLRTSVPPIIDGLLDDAVWREAPSVTGFKTWYPDFGKTMADETTAYFAFDAENLYFAFRALDREPAKVKASMASRDTIRADDWICVNLDSFNDQQALYAFYVNPLGIQMDSRYAAGREDLGFDAVWYSAGRIDDRGYTIEVRIPFKSIRYGGRNPVTMGVVFERFVSRRNEDGTWPALDPKAGMNFLIQMAPIEYRDIRHYTLLEVLPDVTWGRQRAAEAGRLATASSGSDVGVTAKYGLTAQLTADGTYNPDFSQVEADAGQIDINLRAPLFFAEKRPFFLEGQDVFNLGGPSQSGPLQSVVHTRAIVNPRAGVKVTGKLARNDTLASLYAADELPATAAGAAAQAYAHFTVMRYKRSLTQDSYLGGFYAGREQGPAFNRVAGADGSFRIDRSSAVGFYALGSTTRAAGEASSGTGHAVAADFTRTTRRLNLSFYGLDISKGFATETGYLTRNGVMTMHASVAPKFYPTRGIVQRIDLEAVAQQTRDAFSGIWESANGVGVGLMLKHAATASLSYSPSTEVFAGQRFATATLGATATMQVTKELRVQGQVGHGDGIYYSATPFAGRTTRASASVVYQPSEQWSETATFTYANFARATDSQRVYDYGIFRSRTTFQVNRFLFFRGILEYNSFRRQLLTDFLGSFTYIPGTVLHAGYGSLYEKTRWDGVQYVPGDRFAESRRGVFFKASYLWRM